MKKLLLLFASTVLLFGCFSPVMAVENQEEILYGGSHDKVKLNLLTSYEGSVPDFYTPDFNSKYELMTVKINIENEILKKDTFREVHARRLKGRMFLYPITYGRSFGSYKYARVNAVTNTLNLFLG